MVKRLFALVAIAAVATSAACGGSDDGDKGANEPSETSGFELRVIGRDERFEPTELKAPAGSVSVTFDNQDEGILHNIRFYEGDSADGTFVRKSEIRRGLRTANNTMKLEPGRYFYDCEVHPATMTGTLTVSDRAD